MHVGIITQVILRHPFHHLQRALRGSPVIQVNQRLTIYFLLKYREIFPYPIDIKHSLFLTMHHAIVTLG